GLFFAVSDEDRWKEDGRLWCFLPKHYNSVVHHVHTPTAADVLCFDVDSELDDFLPSKIGTPGAKFLPPMAAIASQRFHRIYAQHGTFTVFHRKQDPLEAEANSQSLKELLIPAKAKRQIRDELAVLKIDK